VGAYFFSQAVNAKEAQEEAVYAMKILNGYELDLPLVYDWEFVNETARTANMNKATLMECVKMFCNTVQNAGYKPMVYFNQRMASDYLDMVKLLEYPFWLAMYSNTMTYPYRVNMWQYTSGATVLGIDALVDMNLYFVYE
jgi:GH25 family lysozyme M1 (1,4-beta-N-acetylmuramidase)